MQPERAPPVGPYTEYAAQGAGVIANRDKVSRELVARSWFDRLTANGGDDFAGAGFKSASTCLLSVRPERFGKALVSLSSGSAPALSKGSPRTEREARKIAPALFRYPKSFFSIREGTCRHGSE